MDFSNAQRCSNEAAKTACKVLFPEPPKGDYPIDRVTAMMVDNPQYNANVKDGKHLDKTGKYEVDEKLVYLELEVAGGKKFRLTPWQLARDTSNLGLDQSMDALEMERALSSRFTLKVSDEKGTIVTSNGPKQYRLWSKA